MTIHSDCSKSDDHADVSRSDESVEPQVGGVQDGLERRHDGDVIAEQREVPDAVAPRLQHGERRARHRGFEAQREEHHLALRVHARELQGIERRVHHAHVRAVGLGLQEAALRTRDPHRIPEGRQDDLRIARERHAIIDASHRQHAHRTTGSVHEFDRVLRQQAFQAITKNRVRVAAANFHHLQGPAACRGERRGEARNFADQGTGFVRIAEFIGEAHD